MNHKARMALVVAQVAFSLLLLIGAGLVLRSLEKIRPTRLGFSTDSMVVGLVRLDEAKYDRVKTQEFYRQLSERLVALPGVQSASLIGAVRNAIRELDPKIPLADVQTLSDYFSVGLYPFRMLAAVMGGCGVMALLLATLGIYGIISYSVAQRTRELGIRMALGALRRDILGMVIGQGMTLVIIGMGVGLLLSYALTRLMTSSLLELELPLPVSATDPLTFAIVTVLMALVALIACIVPAQRATKIDPIEALRYE